MGEALALAFDREEGSGLMTDSSPEGNRAWEETGPEAGNDPRRGEGGWKGPGEPPRERLARMGPSALTDPELLAVLLGTGTRGQPVHALAQQLLSTRGGLKALVQHTPLELCALPGLGLARASRVLAALELGRRVQKGEEVRPRLLCARDVVNYLRPTLSALPREVFHVLCLNTRNVLLQDVRVAEGSVSACPVDPREVFAAGLAVRASALILAHNHPSGDPTPSAEDLSLTTRLMEGARLLGLKVLDHVILGGSRSCSMSESNLLPFGGTAEGVRAGPRSGLTKRTER